MHLLLGVFKHGYGRYDAIRDDLTLCFHKKIEDMKSTMEIVEDGSDALGGTPVGQGSAGSLILRLGPGSDGLSERERGKVRNLEHTDGRDRDRERHI